MTPHLPAYPTPRGSLRVWCAYCVRWHIHGSGYGHRVAHCWRPDSPYRLSGYQFVPAGEGVG